MEFRCNEKAQKNPLDTGVRSNQLDDQDENVKVENIRRSRSENAISQGHDEAYIEKRKHKPTPRWLHNQPDHLQERRTMLNRRIIRKSSAVDSSLYSSRNVEAVREQMLQIDDMFKQMMEVHKEYNSLLPLEVQEGSTLLLKNPDVKLPNNRKVAERRLLYLKKWLMKDDRFHQQYIEFMQEILEKDYGKESKATPQDGRVWYLPHHDVYHPWKPDKIRVVFDCSSELNGRSINELLMGPDLTNQLMGVLKRNQQEEVALMADIEKIYFQILVAHEHRSLLRFLWWTDGDMSKDIIDHEMCVHVFGGVSSGACSNYALRRTAIENENKYGKYAAETLKSNFYVDDMLKSVENENKALRLMKDVKSMCQEGGFNLTKFASNSKRVL